MHIVMMASTGTVRAGFREESVIYRSEEAACKQVATILCDYLEGRLDTATVQRLQWHTGQCKACRLVLNSARATIATYYSNLTAAPRPSVPQAA